MMKESSEKQLSHQALASKAWPGGRQCASYFPADPKRERTRSLGSIWHVFFRS
jgi:hypothetical protein